MRIGRSGVLPASGGGSSDPSWSRFLLNSGSTRADPGGGATVTVNSESSSGWTDISRSASALRKISDHSSWSIALTKSDGSALTWSDNFMVQTHIIINQCTDTAADTFAGQMVLPVVANNAAPSTSSHFWWGYGLYSQNGTNVKLGRVYSPDSSTNPQFTSQQIKSTGWLNNGRVLTAQNNSIQRGAGFAWAQYRKLDNSAFQTGDDDIQGFISGMTDFSAGASDQVFVICFVPGWNSSSSYDIVNCQFKLYYQVTILSQDPSA